MLEGKSAEGAVELVPIVDIAQRIGRVRRVERHQARGSLTPGSSPPSLAVALPDEDPVRPGLEAGRVAESREVAPDAPAAPAASHPWRGRRHAGSGARRRGARCPTPTARSANASSSPCCARDTRLGSMPSPRCGARSDALSQGYGGWGRASGAVFFVEVGGGPCVRGQDGGAGSTSTPFRVGTANASISNPGGGTRAQPLDRARLPAPVVVAPILHGYVGKASTIRAWAGRWMAN